MPSLVAIAPLSCTLRTALRNRHTVPPPRAQEIPPVSFHSFLSSFTDLKSFSFSSSFSPTIQFINVKCKVDRSGMEEMKERKKNYNIYKEGGMPLCPFAYVVSGNAEGSRQRCEVERRRGRGGWWYEATSERGWRGAH